MERPVVPAEVLDEIGLKDAVSMKKTATLIQDVKYTGQFSLKFPVGIIEEIGWNAGDRIEIEIQNDELKLRKVDG
jgi:bifunctional DNA-binding transcriptional regulator/antitoxin component of YhaV-PrlF toxin-antitoxin module